MAVKAVAQISGLFALTSGEVTLQIFMKTTDGANEGTETYGPIAPGQITEVGIAAWAKSFMNANWGTDIGALDTVKLISGVGGLL